MDVTEIIPINVNLRNTSQLSIKYQHAICDIFLLWNFKSIIFVMWLLFSCKYCNVGRTYIHQYHSKIAFLSKLKSKKYVLSSEFSDKIHGIHIVQLEASKASNIKNILGFVDLGQKFGDLLLDSLQSYFIVPCFSLDDVIQQISAVVDSGKN